MKTFPLGDVHFCISSSLEKASPYLYGMLCARKVTPRLFCRKHLSRNSQKQNALLSGYLEKFRKYS